MTSLEVRKAIGVWVVLATLTWVVAQLLPDHEQTIWSVFGWLFLVWLLAIIIGWIKTKFF